MDDGPPLRAMAPPLLDALAEICHLTTALTRFPSPPDAGERRARLAARCARATLDLSDAVEARADDATIRARVLDAMRAAREVLAEAERAAEAEAQEAPRPA